jgi:hypothetical protein
MKFTKRFSTLLEKVERSFEKGLHLLTARQSTKRKLCERQSKASTDLEVQAPVNDASRIDDVPDLSTHHAPDHVLDGSADSLNDSNCDNGNGDADEAGSDADSEDSWYMEAPPLNLNYDALKHVATHFLPGSHGACIDISTLQRGTFHEIRVLHFEDGWTCIGRFTREAEPLAKVESELATLEYVRKHTTIPAPEVYLTNHSDNNCVGAPFVLMERMHGVPLDDIWEDLSLDHKLDSLKQLAGIHGQLASQKFDTIGSLRPDGSVGPLLDQVQWWQPLGELPFGNTSDYINSYLKEDNPDRRASARALYPAIKEKLSEHLEQNAGNPTLNAPYRLIHPDLNFRNLLVTQEVGMPPKICGVIDWDWSYTGLLYFLCEYPLSIQDSEFSQESHAENRILRKHFVRCLANCFPKGSADRSAVKQSFHEKNHTLNFWQDTFTLHVWEPEQEFFEVENYMNDIGVESAAYAITGWEPDSETESDDEDAE